jgi:dienelactone hydrolase
MRIFNLMVGILVLVLLQACSKSEGKKIYSEELTYESDGEVLKGFLAYDENIEGKRPGILVVHEWWGHNPYARKRAKMLAELGYTALAIDMFGDGRQANHPDDAMKFVQEVLEDLPNAEARFKAGLNLLKANPMTNPAQIAAIGYCFGGGVVIHMALTGADLDGVVSFHGALEVASSVEPGQVKAKILVLNGADDPFVTKEQINNFKKVMKNVNVDYQLISYSGAKHSFTNPDADSLGKKFNLPLAYNNSADEQSWAELQTFLDTLFEK